MTDTTDTTETREAIRERFLSVDTSNVTQQRADRRPYATGLIGGLLSGLLGIGGGTVMVPLLVLWSRRSQRAAHAISLGAIIPISVAAIAVYGGAGQVNLPDALALTVGAVIGARLGARILSRAPERPLKIAFGVFLLLAAASISLKG